METVLLIGAGGREHALATVITKSPLLQKLYIAQTNELSFAAILHKTEPVDIPASDHAALLDFAKKKQVTLVIIGPEAPLVAGLANILRANNIDVFGPDAEAAQLEASKAFTKRICSKANILTAKYQVCSNLIEADRFIDEVATDKIVVKADGLAGGKGVIITESKALAREAAKEMIDGKFGDASNNIVIEEYIEGTEISCFILCDGKNVTMLPLAQDYKQAYDDDKGPNTGGMGACAPIEFLTNGQKNNILSDIIQPTLNALKEENIEYKGVLYAGLICNDKGIWLLEYNVRFGDPECQTLLPLMEGDWLDIFARCARGKFEPELLQWSDKKSATLVMTDKLYPIGKSEPEIICDDFTDKLNNIKVQNNECDMYIFWAGASLTQQGSLQATGGRVLNITTTSNSLQSALDCCYETAAAFKWKNSSYRTDIGWRITHKN